MKNKDLAQKLAEIGRRVSTVASDWTEDGDEVAMLPVMMGVQELRDCADEAERLFVKAKRISAQA